MLTLKNTMIKAYKYNVENQHWYPVEVEPKIEIKNGILPVTLLETFKNPYNTKSYTSLDEKDNVQSLVDGCNEDDTFSMKKRIDDGFIPNLEAVKICPITGKIWGGHNRLDGVKKLGAKFMKSEYADHIFSEDIPPSEVVKILQDYNVAGKRNEYKKSSLLKKFLALKIEKEKETGEVFTAKSKIHKKSYREFLSSCNAIHKEINILLSIDTIKNNNIKTELLKNIDNKSYSEIDKIVKNNNKKINKVYNPNRFNFINFLKERPSLVNDIRTIFAKDMLKLLTNFNYYDNVFKNNINRVTDKKYGMEKNAITTFLSHLCMSTTCTSFRYAGLECNTAAAATNTPDIQFTTLTKQAKAINENFDMEKIEIKAASYNTSLSDTKIYGGPGFALINPHEYIMPIFNADFSKIFMMLATLTKEDVKREGNDKGVVTLGDWFKNHFHKKDFHFIAGKIYQGNKRPEIEWEDVQDLLNPRTVKEVI
jgi:hypothetical protein